MIEQFPFYTVSPQRELIFFGPPLRLSEEEKDELRQDLSKVIIGEDTLAFAILSNNALVVASVMSERISKFQILEAWVADSTGQWLRICWRCHRYLAACDGSTPSKECLRRLARAGTGTKLPQLGKGRIKSKRAPVKDIAIIDSWVTLRPSFLAYPIINTTRPIAAIYEMLLARTGDEEIATKLFFQDYLPLDFSHSIVNGRLQPGPHDNYSTLSARTIGAHDARVLMIRMLYRWGCNVWPDFKPTTYQDFLSEFDGIYLPYLAPGAAECTPLHNISSCILSRTLTPPPYFLLALWIEEFLWRVEQTLGFAVEQVHRDVFSRLIELYDSAYSQLLDVPIKGGTE